jgi:hypothetical protein
VPSALFNHVHWSSRLTAERSLPATLCLGADGTVETITGTTIHPVWSVDRQEWVPLAELAQGEDQNSAELPDGSGFSSGL